MKPITEQLLKNHLWLRIAEPRWKNPLDPSFAQVRGGRWNRPNSYPTLYLNEDVVTARLNLRRWASRWPWEPEDLRTENAPMLVHARLPRDQQVADAHTPAGLAALGLPKRYPIGRRSTIVDHKVCQAVGATVHSIGLRGLRCRSAQTPRGTGREVAWFPATSRSQAQAVKAQRFADWYYS